METSSWIVIISALLFSAFFSGIEIAFISANRLKIELDKKLGHRSAQLFSYFLKHDSKFITAMLLGNNIALVIYGITMGDLLEPWIAQFSNSSFVILLLQTLISTLIILITAEFIPKVTFRIDPNKTLSLFAFPVTAVFGLLYPFVQFTLWLSEWLMKTFLRINTDQTVVAFNMVDLDHYVKEATSQRDQEELDNEVQIFQNALDFNQVKARECMVPRTEIVALELETPIEELRQLFIETGLSKILIYRDNIDNIIGYTHSYELFKRPDSIKKILLPITIVPESMPASEVMESLIKQKRSIAVVVDEFGGTSGLLTIEDVVEEIFGEIEDEHDKEDRIEERIGENEYRFSARLEVDYLNENYDLELPEDDDYETLGGLIIHLAESIPTEKEVISTAHFVFQIEKVSDKRIECVRVKVKTKED